MEKIFRTLTTGGGILKLRTNESLLPFGPEVKAKVNMETGEVKLFIDKFELERLKNYSE